ncbi:MAG: hypothetical protein GX558_12050, partial [Clostridiales bacterium]|nr:hypothetical protein [Clostridiales bacterium]
MNTVSVAQRRRRAERRASVGRRLNRSRAGNAAMFFLLLTVGGVMAFPLFVIVNNAFKPLDEFFKMPP